MWDVYQVELKMEGRFAASLPKTKQEIEAMLKYRMPTNPPANYVPIAELTETVIEEMGADKPPAETPQEEEFKFGWATFKRNDDGLYYEGRCVRGHLKDCANQVKDVLGVKALKAKVANKVYVMTDIIPLGVKEITGTEERFIQVMTPMGPRSTIKYIDYIVAPVLRFKLHVLSDKVITKAILEALFDYGSVHGLGQERSQGWGRYSYTLNGQ